MRIGIVNDMPLAVEAIVRGYSTLFVPATSLVTQLARAHAEGRLEEKLLHFTKPKLLIVDELRRVRRG